MNPGTRTGVSAVTGRSGLVRPADRQVGHSSWPANHLLGEAKAGRGVALIDCQGDLSCTVLDRLPAKCGNRPTHGGERR